MSTIGSNNFFAEAMQGYDKGQVDNYISKISEAYQTAYDENTAIYGKYNDLLETYNNMTAQEQAGLDSDIMLMYAEMMAQKIIANAQVEAAQVEAEAQKIITEANKEVVQAKAEAQKIVSEANTEAARIVVRARKGIEQAQEIMEQTVGRVQSLLTYNVPNVKNILAG